MEITRRQFGGHLVKGAAIATLAASTIELGGCSVFTDIENWVPVGEAALNSILAELAANNVPLSSEAQAIVKDIEAGFDAITAAVQEYQSTTPPPVGALAKVQTAFKDVVDQLSAFLSNLALPGGNIVTLISGLASIVFSTIAAFLNKLPALATVTAIGPIHSYRLSGLTYTVTAKYRTRRGFKKDWNSQLDSAKSKGVVVTQAAYMKLSLFEHF